MRVKRLLLFGVVVMALACAGAVAAQAATVTPIPRFFEATPAGDLKPCAVTLTADASAILRKVDRPLRVVAVTGYVFDSADSLAHLLANAECRDVLLSAPRDATVAAACLEVPRDPAPVSRTLALAATTSISIPRAPPPTRSVPTSAATVSTGLMSISNTTPSPSPSSTENNTGTRSASANTRDPGPVATLWIDAQVLYKADLACERVLSALASVAADAVVDVHNRLDEHDLNQAGYAARNAGWLRAAVDESQHAHVIGDRPLDPVSAFGTEATSAHDGGPVLVVAIDAWGFCNTAADSRLSKPQDHVTEVLQRTERARIELFIARGDAHDVGPTVDGHLVLEHAFRNISVAVVRRAKECGSGVAHDDALVVQRTIAATTGRPIRAGSQLAEVVKTAGSIASESLPPYWVSMRASDDIAVADAARVFPDTLRQRISAVPRTVVPSDGDDTVSATFESPRTLARSRVLASIVPTLPEFDRVAEHVADEASAKVRRRVLHPAARRRALGELRKATAADTTRSKKAHTATIELMFRDFADECVAFSRADYAIQRMPVSDATVDAWAAKYTALCTSSLERHLGAHGEQLEVAFNATTVKIRDDVARVADETKERSRKLKDSVEQRRPADVRRCIDERVHKLFASYLAPAIQHSEWASARELRIIANMCVQQLGGI